MLDRFNSALISQSRNVGNFKRYLDWFYCGLLYNTDTVLLILGVIFLFSKVICDNIVVIQSILFIKH